MVSREGHDKDSGVVAEGARERQLIALATEPKEVIGEARDNRTGLDAGSKLEEGIATTRLDGLMLELEGKTGTLGEEITLGP